MAAPEGNQFWKLRSQHGRDKIFETPEMLWEEACKYFEYCDQNPLKEEKVLSDGSKVEVNLLRAYTLQGLYFFLKVGQPTWIDYRKRQGFKETIDEIEMVIYNQKFSGAAVNLFNANIIARDLGLVEKQTMQLSKPPERDYSALTDEELNLLAQLEQKALNGKKDLYLS